MSSRVRGSDMLVIFNQIHCVLILLTFRYESHLIDFDDNLSKSHTQHRHFCEKKKSGGRGVHFLVIHRFYNHKGCILINFFTSIVEYHVFVYTCLFLNRITSFEQLKK